MDLIREAIRRRRRRLVVGIVCTVLVMYISFCLISLHAPETLGAPIASDNPLSVGIVVGFVVAWFSVVMALLYVYLCNKTPHPPDKLPS